MHFLVDQTIGKGDGTRPRHGWNESVFIQRRPVLLRNQIETDAADDPTETPTDDTHKVYFCGDDGTISVGIKPIAKEKIAALRWLDITGSAVAIDPPLLASASTEIRGTLDKAQKVFTALIKAGWTKPQALGIVANIRGGE